MTDANEDALIASIQAGDRAALGTLLRQHERRLYNVCLGMVSHREDAAEVTQDALLKIIRNIDRFRGDSKFSTWSTRIAMNQAISFLRKRKLRRMPSLEAGRDGQEGPRTMLRDQLEARGEPGPDQCVEQDEMIELLREAMGRLDEPFKAVLVLRDLEGLDYQQVAQTLEVPVGTVKSRLFRARLALRQEIEKRDRDAPSGVAAYADHGSQTPNPELRNPK